MAARRVVGVFAALLLAAAGLLASAAPASANPAAIFYPPGGCGGTLTQRADFTPTTHEADNQNYGTAIQGGWRPITGSLGVSNLLIGGININTAGNAPIYSVQIRVQIKYADGHISNGPWYQTPSYPSAGWTDLYYASTGNWPEGIGLSSRLEVDAPTFYSMSWLAARCG